MTVIKKNELFFSEATGAVIRAVERPQNGMVTVANVDYRNRSVKASLRKIKTDSIRRRYARV